MPSLKNTLKDFVLSKIVKALEDGENFILNTVCKHAKEQSKILDLGCGDGRMLNELANRLGKDKALYGIDVLENVLPDINESIQITNGNLENSEFPFENETFDIVYSNQTIEHILHKDLFIEETHRILKKGGLYIFSTENIASLDNIVSLFLGQEPFCQHTSIKKYTSTFLSPHFMKTHDGDMFKKQHLGHKNVCSYYGLKRIFQVNNFEDPKIMSFGHLCSFFEKLFPIQNRILVIYGTK